MSHLTNMEKHAPAPFYGSVNSSGAIIIPQHDTATRTKTCHGHSRASPRYERSLDKPERKNGSKLKNPKKLLKKLKKKNKKNKNKKGASAENRFHESVSRTSSYGSCSSGSTDPMDEAVPSALDASHEFRPTPPSYPEENAKWRNGEGNEGAALVANGKSFSINAADSSVEYEPARDKYKKPSKSQKHKTGQKLDLKRQRPGSIGNEKTERNRVGRMKRFWNKIRKSKKKNKIREGEHTSQLLSECNEVKTILTTNCVKLLKRQDNLEELEDRSEKLIKRCEVFARDARRVKNEYASCWVRIWDALRRCCCCPCFCWRSKQ